MNEENEDQSPWDSLIGDLGVEINPEALERKQPAPQALPTVVQERKEVAPPAAAPSDWSGLASSLGLEVPPEEPPPRKTESVAKKESQPKREEKPREERSRREERPRRDDRPRSEPPREGRQRSEGRGDERQRSEGKGEKRERPDRSRERPDRGRERHREKPVEIDDEIIFEEVLEDRAEEFVGEVDETGAASVEQTAEEREKQRISGEAARSAFDALFSADAVNWGSAFVSPRTNVESSFLYTEGEEAVFAEDIPETAQADDDDEEETKKRPRRRRRGGRGRGRGRKSESAESGDEDSEEGTVLDRDETDDSLTDEGKSDDGDEETNEDRPEKRPRRRRPRGRVRRGDEAEDSSSGEDDSSVRRRIASHVDGGDDDDDDDDELGSDEEEARTGHRNLPTWNDAIGVIVEGNLAQRSKAPAKQQSAPRGGRGRGGRRHKKT